jgi:dTDP-4-dehydrorhamnose 3,5-epimerase
MNASIQGVQILTLKQSSDSRGSFFKLYSESYMLELDIDVEIAQINLSTTNNAGTVRGMHYQNPPYGETKIIRCVRGKIFDVVIDIRRSSPTFLAHQAFELDSNSDIVLVIPPGCAHGFQVLEGPAEVMYAHSMEYKPHFEAGINPLDPIIGISWPLEPINLSVRDSTFANLNNHFEGIDV